MTVGRVFLSLLLIVQLVIVYIKESKLIGLKLFGFGGSLLSFCNSFVSAVPRVVVSFPFCFISFTAAVIL